MPIMRASMSWKLFSRNYAQELQNNSVHDSSFRGPRLKMISIVIITFTLRLISSQLFEYFAAFAFTRTCFVYKYRYLRYTPIWKWWSNILNTWYRFSLAFEYLSSIILFTYQSSGGYIKFIITLKIYKVRQICIFCKWKKINLTGSFSNSY